MVKTKKNRKSAVDVIKKVSKKQTSSNPFEVHINRSKFKVLGQKSKNDVGLPGVSRSKAIQKRKVTLLQEFKFQDKTNKFFDRRIGEHNKNMTKEDKVMARFTAEKMKAHNKSSMFNLDDDVVLTHGGRTLEEIEQFEDPRSDDEDDADGRNMKGTLDPEFVKEAHFGGGTLSVASRDGELSRKDLISQLISDSKKRKAEKQQLKESTLQLTEQLDSEWKDLLPLLNAGKKSESGENVPVGKSHEKPPPAASKPAVDKSSFDFLVKELRFEATGKPSDKLKSEDEVVRQEKEKLEKLERERVRRMTLHESDKARSGGRAYKSADDLDDGFALDNNLGDDDNESDTGDKNEDKPDSEHEESDEDMDEEGVNRGVKRKRENDGDVNEEIDDEEDEDAGSDEESESGEDSFDDLNEESDGEDEKEPKENDKTAEKDEKRVGNFGTSEGKSDTKGEENPTKEVHGKISKIRFAVDSEGDMDGVEEFEGKVNAGKGILKNSHNPNEDVEVKCAQAVEFKELDEELGKGDLPFTFQVPTEYEEMVGLFEGRPVRDVKVILERMIKVNHWSLGGDNKAKLNQLFAFLLQYLDDSVDVKEPKKCWQVLNSLSPVLFELCLMDPDTSAAYVRSVVQEKYETYCRKESRCPGVDSLLFLKLVSTLFPTSDARHYVTTPALIYLCHALGKSVPVSTRDVAVGVFLATLCVEYIDLSKRYLPELVNYLQGSLLLFCHSPPLPLNKPFKASCQQLLTFKAGDLVQPSEKKSTEAILDGEKSNIVESKKSISKSPKKSVDQSGVLKISDNPVKDVKKNDSPDSAITAADLVASGREISVEFKVKVLTALVKLVTVLLDKYGGYDAAYLIFDNMVVVLRRIREELSVDVEQTAKRKSDGDSNVILKNDAPSSNVILDAVLEQIDTVVAQFDALKRDNRFTFVAKEKEKPKILRLFEPEIKPVLKFHTKGAQKEREKLMAKYKKEMKGAVRELRKDGRFLHRVKLRQQEKKDEERRRKVREILGGCATQEGEIRNLKRGKK